ncbi:MAG: decarboxylating NADP(+)-dependent phosphogluconate dehydrogenase [Bacteroidota bacterium]
MAAGADIGLVGLAVMGENLVLNMESRGYTVAVYNRTTDKTDRFLKGRAAGKRILGTRSLAELTGCLKRPRTVMLMVKAGRPVDEFIELLLPHLEKGDIIIDGGNSHFGDTIRRTRHVEAQGLLYIGTGVSGGEEGALRGPSIMPGGSEAAWQHVKPVFQAIAARVEGGTPCCDWVGADGAGHFVKMVHNGIEYGDMQLICEAYQLLRDYAGLDAGMMQQVFARWNEGMLNSYLIEITRDILGYREPDGTPLVERILDTAGQKGTGKWTSVAALDLGIPLTLISEAVSARCLSALKEERVAASGVLAGPTPRFQGDRNEFVRDLELALYASKIVSYAQGFTLLRAAAAEHRWNLNYGGIALLWRGGCIIRSVFLGKIKEAFDRKADLPNLLLDSFFRENVERAQGAWRRVVAAAVTNGIWIPAFATALSYYDGYRAARLPANLLQAQRDYFGAHQYERVDRPRGEFFHTNWTGRGGETASTAYTA